MFYRSYSGTISRQIFPRITAVVIRSDAGCFGEYIHYCATQRLIWKNATVLHRAEMHLWDSKDGIPLQGTVYFKYVLVNDVFISHLDWCFSCVRLHKCWTSFPFTQCTSIYLTQSFPRKECSAILPVTKCNVRNKVSCCISLCNEALFLLLNHAVGQKHWDSFSEG